MSGFIEFLMTPTELQNMALSWWDARNRGMIKLMQGVRSILLKEGSLSSEWRVRVHMHDFPTPQDAPRQNLIELQTVSQYGGKDAIFPDWGFGGWYSMGMEDWWPFVTNLARAGERPPEDPRAFWKGACLGVPQRIKYIEKCKEQPDRFAGEFMTWDWRGPPENFTPMEDQCRHAVLVDLTGVGFSGRLKMLAFTGRPLMIARRQWWCWAGQEIAERGLHTEVEEDLSDISERYCEVVDDMKSAAARADELKEFCMHELTFEKACERGASILRDAMLTNSALSTLN